MEGININNKNININYNYIMTIKITNENFITAVNLMNTNPTEAINNYGEFNTWDLSNVNSISDKLFSTGIPLSNLYNLGFTVENLKQKFNQNNFNLDNETNYFSGKYFVYNNNIYYSGSYGLYKLNTSNNTNDLVYNGAINQNNKIFLLNNLYIFSNSNKIYILNLDTLSFDEITLNNYIFYITIVNNKILCSYQYGLVVYSITTKEKLDEIENFKPGGHNSSWSSIDFCVNGNKCYMMGGFKEGNYYNTQLYEYDSEKSFSSTNPKKITNYDYNESNGNSSVHYTKKAHKMTSYNDSIVYADDNCLKKFFTKLPLSDSNPKILLPSNNNYHIHSSPGQVIYNDKFYTKHYFNSSYRFGYYDMINESITEIPINDTNLTVNKSLISNIIEYDGIIYLHQLLLNMVVNYFNIIL